MENIIISDDGMEVATTIKAEAKRTVFAVLRDTLTNLSFADDTPLEDFNEEFHSNITYSVMRDYKDGRYSDVTTAFRIISASAGYLWALENREDGI